MSECQANRNKSNEFWESSQKALFTSKYFFFTSFFYYLKLLLFFVIFCLNTLSNIFYKKKKLVFICYFFCNNSNKYKYNLILFKKYLSFWNFFIHIDISINKIINCINLGWKTKRNSKIIFEYKNVSWHTQTAASRSRKWRIFSKYWKYFRLASLNRKTLCHFGSVCTC